MTEMQLNVSAVSVNVGFSFHNNACDNHLDSVSILPAGLKMLWCIFTKMWPIILNFLYSCEQKCRRNTKEKSLCLISIFRHEVDENCILLGYYAASVGN